MYSVMPFLVLKATLITLTTEMPCQRDLSKKASECSEVHHLHILILLQQHLEEKTSKGYMYSQAWELRVLRMTAEYFNLLDWFQWSLWILHIIGFYCYSKVLLVAPICYSDMGGHMN